MRIKKRSLVRLGICGLFLVFASGCATQRLAPPLFDTPPLKDELGKVRLIKVPEVIQPKNTPLQIHIPQKKVVLSPNCSTMPAGVVIKRGASVVINVPASAGLCDTKEGNEVGFCTDGYFNLLEQYVERGLMMAGLKVKDRSKFEAKLRGIRSRFNQKTGSNELYSVVLSNLKSDLQESKIDRDQYAEQAQVFRDRLVSLAPSKSARELTDITELIRAAQDGEVKADYILQVNDLSIASFSGKSLQLEKFPEVRSFLLKNPGLNLGVQNGRNEIASTLRPSWAQARFNAKLINVKTGVIDWIGDLSIDSLAVLKDGISIYIGVRKYPINQKEIIESIEIHNKNVLIAYNRASLALKNLNKAYKDAMGYFSYYGTPFKKKEVQAKRKKKVNELEALYNKALKEYREMAQKQPIKIGARLRYAYDVDPAVFIPNILQPKNKKEQQKLVKHVKELGLEITRLLPQTIQVGE